MLKTVFSFGCFITICLFDAAQYARAQVSCAPDSTVSTDSTTENCRQAFCALPSSDQQGDIPQRDFASHILQHKDVYTKYLEACFSRWDELQEYSKEFLGDVYGALFFKGSDGLVLVCSGFRISQNVVVTARHCIYDNNYWIPSPTQFIFRLISDPNRDLPVLGEITNSFSRVKNEAANDFDDYWFLKIADFIEFHRAKDEFRSSVRRGSPLLIAGINRVAFVLDAHEDVSQWASAFRWTKVWGAQWIPTERLPQPPPTPTAESSCIYHKAPTFGGMSGSPIIGSDFDMTGKPLRRFVVGIHLRSGVPDPAHENDSDCGSYPNFNIGLALPAEILDRVNQSSSERNEP
jgi:V8-like Glu-specific endopeptidase